MKWDIKDINKWKAEEHPLGATIVEAGNAKAYDTGSWRSLRPVLDEEKCRQCLFCWIYCPDAAVVVENEKLTGFDYKHCKGCGICAQECPHIAILMVDEAQSRAKGGE